MEARVVRFLKPSGAGHGARILFFLLSAPFSYGFLPRCLPYFCLRSLPCFLLCAAGGTVLWYCFQKKRSPVQGSDTTLRDDFVSR